MRVRASCRWRAAASSRPATPRAQATVAAGSLPVVTGDVVQAANDKRQIEPALRDLERLPKQLGKAQTLLADSSDFSEANVTACAKAGIAPLIAH